MQFLQEDEFVVGHKKPQHIFKTYIIKTKFKEVKMKYILRKIIYKA